MSSVHRIRALLVAGALALLVSGCSSTERPEVERVATEFEDSSGDPAARCDLLMPQTLEQVEEEAGAPCTDAIGDLPLDGGDVSDVHVWGGNAQVRMAGDTVFLNRTPAGWRIAAAICSPRPERPYDCEVEGA